MSQVYTSGGSSPPIVATTYITDSGNAVPAANILNVLGDGDSIITSASGNTINILPADIEIGTGSTVGAVTDDVVTFALGATPGTYQIEASVVGFESTTPAGTGFRLFAAFRTDGASATLCNTVDSAENAEAALSGADATLVASGNNAILRVTGVAALTISWKAKLFYTFVS